MDKEFAISILSTNDFNNQRFDPFRKDRDVVLAAVRLKGIVLQAIKQSGLALKYAVNKLNLDNEVVLEAMKNYYPAYKHAGKAMKDVYQEKTYSQRMEALEALIRMEKMQAELKPKQPTQTRSLKI